MKSGTKALNKHYDIIMVHGHIIWGACIFDMQKYENKSSVVSVFQYMYIFTLYSMCISIFVIVCRDIICDVHTVNVHAATYHFHCQLHHLSLRKE